LADLNHTWLELYIKDDLSDILLLINGELLKASGIFTELLLFRNVHGFPIFFITLPEAEKFALYTPRTRRNI
jgi:hypothetical protein